MVWMLYVIISICWWSSVKKAHPNPQYEKVINVEGQDVSDEKSLKEV